MLVQLLGSRTGPALLTIILHTIYVIFETRGNEEVNQLPVITEA